MGTAGRPGIYRLRRNLRRGGSRTAPTPDRGAKRFDPFRVCVTTYVGYLESISCKDALIRKLLIPPSRFELSHRLLRGRGAFLLDGPYPWVSPTANDIEPLRGPRPTAIGPEPGTASYQLPRSPTVSMTRESRTAPFSQFVWMPRSAPSQSPCSIA